MIETRLLCRIEMTLHPIQDVGTTPHGQRRIIPVAGGSFAGERLRGRVHPHAGSDWLLLRNDGTFQADARVALETDDGAAIAMTYRALRRTPPDVAARMARGERVEPTEYYLRSAPFFETGDARYAWLNSIVTIGIGERLPDGAAYDVHEVL